MRHIRSLSAPSGCPTVYPFWIKRASRLPFLSRLPCLDFDCVQLVCFWTTSSKRPATKSIQHSFVSQHVLLQGVPFQFLINMAFGTGPLEDQAVVFRDFTIHSGVYSLLLRGSRAGGAGQPGRIASTRSHGADSTTFIRVVRRDT